MVSETIYILGLDTVHEGHKDIGEDTSSVAALSAPEHNFSFLVPLSLDRPGCPERDLFHHLHLRVWPR